VSESSVYRVLAAALGPDCNPAPGFAMIANRSVHNGDHAWITWCRRVAGADRTRLQRLRATRHERLATILEALTRPKRPLTP
jgi:hypothetical protein